MEYTTLKNSELKVSRLCFGGCPMGGHGWGNVSRDLMMDAVNKAFESGINFFDTADVYGLGESESTLGAAIGGRRKDAVIATKFGVRRGNDGRTYYDNSPGWIEQAVEDSLRRLNTDYIDLYQIHYRDGMTPIEDVYTTLENLKKRGLIRYYGLSNIYEADLAELNRYQNHFVSFQNEYSLANRSHERDIQNVSQKLGCSVLTWGSLGQGILSGKYDANVRFEKNDRRSREAYGNFHGEKLEHNMRIVDTLRVISNKIKMPIPSVAIRWILDYLDDAVVIVGIKSPLQLEMNVTALGWKLDQANVDQLEQLSRLNEVSV